jgi:hypothetical protein
MIFRATELHRETSISAPYITPEDTQANVGIFDEGHRK